jgi:hypothetical protein
VIRPAATSGAMIIRIFFIMVCFLDLFDVSFNIRMGSDIFVKIVGPRLATPENTRSRVPKATQ